jgi:predicted Fe-Mo cluster-binding NifX family protein
MKIAFPVIENKGIDSDVHGHFGSAPFFVFVDLDTDSIETFENPDQDHDHGACNPMSALGGRQVDGVVVGRYRWWGLEKTQ